MNLPFVKAYFLHGRVACCKIKLVKKGQTFRKEILNMQFQQTDDKRPLEQFGRNLIEEVKKGNMDPVIGRDEEIRNVIRILSRKN